MKTALPNEQHDRARQDFRKNHKTELPSTCMCEKEDKLEFQVKNIVIPNNPETEIEGHNANEMEEEELVQEDDNDEKKIDDRKTDNRKMVNPEVGSHVVFQKALELFMLHQDPNNDLFGMDHEGRVMILNSVDGANHDLNDKSHTEC